MATGDGYIVRCPSCGTNNRIPADKIGQTPKCGKCKTPILLDGLFTGRPVTVQDATFGHQVLKSPLPVLLDCFSAGCPACKMLNPVITELASELRGRVKVSKLNTEQNPVIASRLDIRSVPTLLIYDRGRVKDTIVGAAPKPEILRRLRPFLY